MGENLSLFICAFSAIGTIVCFIGFFQESTQYGKIKSFCIILVGFLFTWFTYRLYDVERNLLNNYTFVSGKTIGFCKSGKSGKGIEFEYYVNGIRYTNCNVTKDLEKVKVPGGDCLVRVSETYPEYGRTNFNK